MASASTPSPSDGDAATEAGNCLPAWGWMAAPARCSVSAALREHLQHLGLQDFPCGLGSWVRGRGGTAMGRGLGADPAEQEEAVLLGQESPEARMELLRDPHSPWALLPACSPQDQHLREMAVLAPELVRGSSIFQVLRSLRIVGKGVSAVDEGLLQLEQLEELILSANYISRISSVNLPRTLKGNPLALIPAYRGFLVDSLPKLCILDDIRIGPQERHQFHALARQPDLPLRSEARVVVSVGEIKGVPDPRALQQLEVGSQAPVITYSYCVTYEFVEGEEIKDGSSTEVTEIHQDPVVAALDVDRSAQDVRETKGQQEPAAMEEPKAHSGVLPVLGKESSLLRVFLCPCTAKVFVTPTKPWADTIDCSYRREHTAKDLVGLKSYLMSGTTISVVEEKVSVKGPQPSAEACPRAAALQVPVPRVKQKKEKPRELRSDPPIRRTLGTGRVALEALLATEDLVATVCDFGVLITEQPLQPPSLEETVKKSRKPKAERESQAEQKTAVPAKGD
uniref:Leucine rich repeat containing 43 n=1 Tax=Athene cunicularia TaxID=194338 RepID=A0A663MLX0_ATHCN